MPLYIASLIIGFILSLLLILCPSWVLASSPLVLEGAPFADLAAWASDTSAKTVIVPDSMAFKVWLRSPGASSSSALALLRSAASANGWTMTDKGGVISFIPADKEIRPELQASPSGPAVAPPLPLETALLPFVHRSVSSLLPVAVSMAPDARFSLGPDNSLSITAPALTLERLRKDLPALDQPQSRFRIEAIISEELQGASQQQGVNISAAGPAGSVSLQNVGTVLNGSGLLAQLVSLGDFSGLYAFLSSSSKYVILSTPYVLADDGERGTLHVGDNVPILTGSTVSNGQTTTTYTRQDVGVILSIGVKRVGGRIALDILQEASSVSPSAVFGQVVTSQRKITTKTSVLPGEVLDLGGLVTDSTRTEKTGVPFLRSLPWIGVFFRGETTITEARVLRVYLRVVQA